MTTLRPIASRTYTPAFANTSYHGSGESMSDRGGASGRTYSRTLMISIEMTIVADRWRFAKSLIAARWDGNRPRWRLAVRAVMRGLPMRHRGCRWGGRAGRG